MACLGDEGENMKGWDTAVSLAVRTIVFSVVLSCWGQDGATFLLLVVAVAINAVTFFHHTTQPHMRLLSLTT
jgi:fatty acid desaturase